MTERERESGNLVASHNKNSPNSYFGDSLLDKLADKKAKYKQEINDIASAVYNREQKQLALDILDGANEHNIDAIYTFITQRVKIGFTFDTAPEVNHGAVSLAYKDNKKSFGINGAKHKMIIGENYDALKNLLVTHREKIDVIYIDPPYNTEAAKGDGNDHKDEVKASKFIYRDKFTRNGWLNLIQERLKLARQLLSESGVIFISIDDNEQAYLKVLCDEIFGEENSFVPIVWDKCNAQNDADGIQKNHEYILVYCKYGTDLQHTSTGKKKLLKDGNGWFYLGSGLVTGGAGGTLRNRVNLGHSIYFNEQTRDFIAIDDYDKELAKISNDEKAVYQDNQDLIAKGYTKIIRPPRKQNALGCWTWKMEKINNTKHLLHITENYSISQKVYIDNPQNKESIEIESASPPKSIIKISSGIGTTTLNDIFGEKTFQNPKPVSLIKHLLKISSTPNSIILDFFAGSGTTGQAVMELNEEDGGNRQCILVSNNENNIGHGIMYERIYRIVNGIGTNGEEFKWQYKNGQKSLINNIWEVFEIKTHELQIDDFEKAKELLADAEKQFKLLNENYEHRDFNIYHQLASLNPYKK